MRPWAGRNARGRNDPWKRDCRGGPHRRRQASSHPRLRVPVDPPPARDSPSPLAYARNAQVVRHPSLPEIVDNFSAAAPALHFHLRTDCSGQRKRMRPRAFVQLGPLPIPPGRFLSCEQGRLHPTGVGRRASQDAREPHAAAQVPSIPPRRGRLQALSQRPGPRSRL